MPYQPSARAVLREYRPEALTVRTQRRRNTFPSKLGEQEICYMTDETYECFSQMSLVGDLATVAGVHLVFENFQFKAETAFFTVSHSFCSFIRNISKVVLVPPSSPKLEINYPIASNT